MKKNIKKLIPILCLVPLVVGTLGYGVSGDFLTDALYAGFALYFTNPVSDAYNGFIEFARWTAPLVTMTAVLHILRDVWKDICRKLSGLSKDSVAVYSDEDIEVWFDKKTVAVYPGEEFQDGFKSHIILFSSDRKSLNFYEENKKSLIGKNIYIGLRELEQGLTDISNTFTPFDINRSISRQLWKKISLWEKGKENIEIVIYGNDALSGDLLYTGLLLNLFSARQHIRYHLISDNDCFQTKYHKLSLMNDDEICYCGTEDKNIWNVIGSADFVIISDQLQAKLFQTIVVRTVSGTVYYYSPNEGDIGSYISFRKPVPFGRSREIFTDGNIRRQNLIQSAMKLNERYAREFDGEKEWDKLSGFLKESNISSADFNGVLAKLPMSMGDMELAGLEHIRWCRFYYLNYWERGYFTDGRSKDNVRRLHKDLIPFDELDETQRNKDLITVRMVRADK